MNQSIAPIAPAASETESSFRDRFVARDNVNRTQEEVPTLEKIENSSMLHGMLYVGARQVLYVHFKKGGNVYRYAKVTREEYEGIKSGKLDPKGENSIGRALSATMVDAEKHVCTQIASKFDPANYGG